MFSVPRRSRVVRAGLSSVLAAFAIVAYSAGVAAAQAVDVSNNNVPVAADNQVPVSACNDQIPVNALGVQVPVHEIGAALGVDLLNQGAASPVEQDQSCDAKMAQDNQTGDSAEAGAAAAAAQPSSGIVAVKNNNIPAVEGNQIPVQACNDQIPVNALGVQVPVQEIKAALGLAALSPESATPVQQDESCDPEMAQNGDVGDGSGK